MAKKDGKALHLFERICVQLIFLLSAFLILFLGIRAAGSTIDFAQSERIEIINNLVEGLSEGDRIANQSKSRRRWSTVTRSLRPRKRWRA